MIERQPPPLMTPDEAAAALRLNVSTVRRMLDRGELDAFQTTKHGHWRIRVDREGLPRLKTERAA